MGGTLCKIGSPLLSFLLCSLCTPLHNYNQMLDASGGGQYGVQIDYITTIGAGNSRVYSRWSGEPYVLSNPNGGTANWAAGQYYAEP